MLPKFHTYAICFFAAIILVCSYFEMDYQIDLSVQAEILQERLQNVQYLAYIEDLVAFEDELKNTRYIPVEVIPMKGELNVAVVESFYLESNGDILYTYTTMDVLTGDVYSSELSATRIKVV